MRFLAVSLLAASTAARSSLRVRELGGLNVTVFTKDVVNADTTNGLGNVRTLENVESSNDLESVGNTPSAEAAEGVVAGGPVSSLSAQFCTSN